jgi:hypothetical protein
MAPTHPAAKLEREKKLKSVLGESTMLARDNDTHMSQPSAQPSSSDSKSITTRPLSTISKRRFVVYHCYHLLLSSHGKTNSTDLVLSCGTSLHVCVATMRRLVIKREKEPPRRTDLFVYYVHSRSSCSTQLQDKRKVVPIGAAYDS